MRRRPTKRQRYIVPDSRARGVRSAGDEVDFGGYPSARREAKHGCFIENLRVRNIRMHSKIQFSDE
ncbi:hypothetical protein B0H11DRAFT_2201169 [Mycena galericulata]|nr:hypothetical protein B0H11DRAFT_2201169 [Mycena galericulata]